MPNKYLSLIDAPAPQQPTPAQPRENPYLRLLEEQNRAVGGVLEHATKANPDQAARARQLARQTGLPIGTVERDLDEVARRARVQQLKSAVAQSPILRAQLADPEFAKLAHDDVEPLTEAERRFGVLKAPEPPRPTAGNILRGLGTSFTEGFEQVRQGLRMQFDDLFGEAIDKWVEKTFPNAAGLSRAERTQLGMTSDAQRRFERAQGRVEATTPAFESRTAQGVYGGVQSILQTAPAIAAGVATRNTGLPLAVLGAQTEAQAYGRYRSRGATPGEAFAGAAGEGAVEVATELMPMGFLVKRFGRAGAGEFLTGLLAREIPSEQVATLVQDAIDTAVANPDKTWADYLAERPDAAYQTLVATVVQSGVMGGVSEASRRLSRQESRAQAAEGGAQFIEGLTQIAAASKVRERDPESFERFLQAAAEDSPVSDVYVDGRVLAQALQQAAPEVQQAVAPLVGEQLAEAVATGGDVRIPVGEFVTRFTGTGLEQSLIDHIRTDPNGMTRAEAQTFLQSDAGQLLRQEVEQAVAKQADADAFQQSAEKVREEILGQLNTTGRFTPDVNSAYATMFSNFYAVQAARLGITPEEMAARYPVRVQAEGVAGGQVLDQITPLTEDEYIARINPEGRRVDESERPNLGMGDMYGMAPRGARQIAEMEVEELGRVRFVESDGNIYALAHNPDLGEEDVVGYAMDRGNSTELAVVAEAQGKGIGAELSYQYRRRKPFAPSGGLTEAGERTARAAFRRMTAEGVTLYQYALPETIEVDGAQRPTTNSNGQPIAATEEGVRNFWRWFGDSRVVDEQGRPLVVYHGTDAEFEAFDIEAEPRNYDTDRGKIFFTSARELAEGYARDTGWAGAPTGDPRVIEAYVSLRDPYRIDNADDPTNEWDQDGDLIARFAESGAHDGILIQTENASEKLVIAFNPEQIKSATGNAGTFDPSDPNIYRQGETSARGQIQFGRDITQDPSVITLLQKADLSTFLHESGHFFLEVMTDMASRPDAPQAVIDDMNALLRWFGVESLDQWRAMSLEEKREHHEKLARGFEAYLFEGNAPNLQLQGVFQRFRAWLLNVYRSLTALNVELTDDVRRVFDRMLATPETIREAEAARGMAPLFTSAEEAGMTPEEFAAYREQSIQASQDAITELESRGLRDMQWLANAKSRVLKELQRDAAAKRAAIQREVTDEVMGERVNRAREFFKRGLYDGNPVEGPHKLSIEEVDALYADRPVQYLAMVKEALGYGQYGMLARENAIHPEQAAELFGYSSADEMIQDIVTAEDPKVKIEGLTDQRMLERYGDLATPEAIARAADKAIHNEARQRFVATELNALNKLARRPRVLTNAVKQFAEATVARLRVRDVRPSQYAAAEARAASASTEALRAGDTMRAAQEKQNQLVQSYAARAAYNAQEEIEKGLDYLRKFSREGTRKSIDPDYIDQIDQLLERYELRAVTNKELDKRVAFSKWLEAQRAMGLEPDIAPEIIETASRANYRMLTVAEFRGLVDAVRQIEHLGRLKKKLLTAKEKRELDEAAMEIAQSIADHARREIADLRTRETLTDNLATLGKQFLASHRKMASLARQMDGSQDGGPLWEYFIRTMNAAADREAAMRAKATQELSKLVDPILSTGKLGGKGKFYPTLGISLNREERISIALNVGNAGNFQRLLDGEGWTLEDLQPVLDDLTKEEWDFVQSVWDYFESYRPQIAAKEKRVYGREPEWVEPTPVNTKFGTYRGGYYPIKYDPNRSAKAAEHADAEEARAMLRGAYTSATTRRSFTKQRADEVHGRPLLYSFAGIYQGTTEVIHDLAWHEWLIDVNRLLRHKRVDNAMRRHYGPEAVRVFKSAIEDIARGDAPAQNVFERAVNHLRVGTTVAGMGWNLMTSLMQPLGLTQSMVRVGPSWVAKGLRQWLGSPVDTVAEINGRSDFMRLRAQTMQREINEIQNRVRGQSELRAKVDASFFVLIQKAQMIADVPTWLGAYEKAIAEGESEARAVALADQAVRDSQGGGQVSDLAQIQRGGPLQKLFTNFYSYFNVTYNLAAERTAATDFKKPGEVMRLALDYLLLFTVPAVLGGLLRHAVTGDEDDDLAEKLAAEQISYLFGTMVGLRELSGVAQTVAGVQQFNTAYGGPAGLRFFQESAKLATQVNQGEWDRALRKSLINTGGILFHLPSGQVNRTWDGATALSEGDTQNPAALIAGAPPQ